MSFSTGLKNKSPTVVQRTQTSQTKSIAFTVNILTQTGSTVIPIQADKTRNATDSPTTPMGFFPCYIFWTIWQRIVFALQDRDTPSPAGSYFTLLSMHSWDLQRAPILVLHYRLKSGFQHWTAKKETVTNYQDACIICQKVTVTDLNIYLLFFFF